MANNWKKTASYFKFRSTKGLKEVCAEEECKRDLVKSDSGDPDIHRQPLNSRSSTETHIQSITCKLNEIQSKFSWSFFPLKSDRITTSVYSVLLLTGSIILLILYHIVWLPLCTLCPSNVGIPFESLSARIFWSFCCLVEKLDCLKVTINGDSLDANKSALFISNHKSLMDYAILANIGESNGICGGFDFVGWKRRFKIPDVKVLYHSIQSNQNWRFNNKDLEHQLGPIVQGMNTNWTIVFPEVDIANEKALIQNKVFMASNCLPALNYVLYPRFPVFVQTAQKLRTNPKFSTIYDISIIYWSKRNGPNSIPLPESPSIVDILFSKPGTWTAEVYVREYEIKCIGKKSKAIEKWLEKIWYEKDEIINKMVA